MEVDLDADSIATKELDSLFIEFLVGLNLVLISCVNFRVDFWLLFNLKSLEELFYDCQLLLFRRLFLLFFIKVEGILFALQCLVVHLDQLVYEKTILEHQLPLRLRVPHHFEQIWLELTNQILRE